MDSFVIYRDYINHIRLLDDADAGMLLKALLAYADGQPTPELGPAAGMAFSFITGNMDRDHDKYQARCEANARNGKKGGRPRKQTADGQAPATTHAPADGSVSSNDTSLTDQTPVGRPSNADAQVSPLELDSYASDHERVHPSSGDTCTSGEVSAVVEHCSDGESGTSVAHADDHSQVDSPAHGSNQPHANALVPTGGQGASRRRKAGKVDCIGFEKFWQAYPKKRSRGEAEAVWAELNVDGGLLEEILSGLEAAKQHSEWRNEHGRYIPYPAKWLRAKGWHDLHAAPGYNGHGYPERVYSDEYMQSLMDEL